MVFVVPPSAVIVNVTVVTPDERVEMVTVLSDGAIYDPEGTFVIPVPGETTYDRIGQAALLVVNIGKT